LGAPFTISAVLDELAFADSLLLALKAQAVLVTTHNSEAGLGNTSPVIIKAFALKH
jgi:hypothetical protein